MQCPICDIDATFVSHAVLAPWISQIIEEAYQPTKLFCCKNCDFDFFELRYSEGQVKKLYASYRSEFYYSIRHRWEPWYKESENDIYDPASTSKNILKRKHRMNRELVAAGHDKTFKNALDYGGDSGQFFPDNIIGTRYLLDVSNLPTSNFNIETVGSVQDIPQGTVDLVMACMILEHFSHFNNILDEITQAMAINGILYIEVPVDRFRVLSWHQSESYRRYLNILLRVPPLFVLLDFITGVVRNYFQAIPFFGIVKQSEHINYFSSDSIQRLLGKYLEVTYISDLNTKEKHGKMRLGFLAAVAIKRLGK